jgi:aldose 1-epimerase
VNKGKRIYWHGREAFALAVGNYGALIVPSLGANVLRLWFDCSVERLDILRTPKDAGTLLRDPYAYGVPVLFPANRVADGFYEWDGIRYTFPQNYPNGVHIHGVLHNRPWPVKHFRQDEDGAELRMELDTRTDEGLRRAFPIDVLFRLDIKLSEKGLIHHFTVENHGEHSFPAGLAYHTAFNAPFRAAGSADNIYISIPIEARCIDDPVDRLPAGETGDLNELERRIASVEGARLPEEPIDYLYTARPESPREAILRDTAIGWEVTYTADTDNQYRIIWNATAREGFIAIEPQTWLSNAMKCRDPAKFGAVLVPPGGVWTNRTRIALQPCGKQTDNNYG